jgi:predicted outer membrane protein
MDAVKRLLLPFVIALFMMVCPVVANAAQPAGTLSALDAELIVKVRLANLWEIPGGRMAMERSNNPRTQEAGRTMMNDHLGLQTEVERLAGLYGLKLPDEPWDVQKSWLTEMAAASGPQFDTVFAMRLRAAHGIIFPIIAKARVETTDPEIRKFATAANTIVMRHMTLLEGTGAVDYAAMNDPTPLMLMSDSDGLDMVVALTLVPLVVAVAIFLLWFATGRNRRRPGGGPRWSKEPDDDDDDDRRDGDSDRPRGGTRLFADKQPAR